MSFTKNLSSYIHTYGSFSISVKAHAEGFRDSELKTITYVNSPKLTYVNASEITFSNVLAGVTSFDLYIDGDKVGTYSHDPNDTTDVAIDISDFGLDDNMHEFYIVVTAPDKTNTITTFTSATIQSAKIFGVSGLYAESPTLTRTDHAVGMTWVNSSGTITSDLDNEFPFNAIHDVTLDSGDVMVEIPEMYFRVGYDASNRLTDIAVSSLPVGVGNWYHTPAFQVGKYLTNSSGYSKTGQTPGTASNFNSNITSIKNKGMYYETIYHYTILEFLFWIYFATKNSQSVLNVAQLGSLQTTGVTNSNQSKNCIVSNRFKFLGIEDFLGNQYRMLAGSYNNYFYDVYNNQNAILNSTERSTSGKVTLSYDTVNSSNNYNIKALGWDHNHPFICIPMEVTNASTYTTYFCDGVNSNAWRNGSYAPYLGASYSTDYTAPSVRGLGSWYLNTWAFYSAFYGCRLVKFL